MSEAREAIADAIRANAFHMTVFTLINKTREGMRLDSVDSAQLWFCAREFIDAKYPLPPSMKIVTEAASSSTATTTTRTVVVYILDDYRFFAYAPPTTSVAVKTGRTVKHTGIGSPIMTPKNVIAMLVIKATVGKNTETKEEIQKLKVIKYGEYDETKALESYWEVQLRELMANNLEACLQN